MKITSSSQLTIKYLALPNSIGGRGGVQRYFFLSQDVPFSERLYDMGDEWATEKARLKESGENPSATVPVVVVTDNEEEQLLVQHIATLRLLAKVHGKTSGDDYQDYVQDMVADEYQGFRDTWVQKTFAATDDEKAAYKTVGLPEQLAKFNALYKKFKTHDVYMSVNPNNDKPLWGDAAMFGLVRDYILTGHMTMDQLQEYPELKAMYEAYEKIPAVAEWIEKARAK